MTCLTVFFFPGIPMTAIAHKNKTLTKIGECYWIFSLWLLFVTKTNQYMLHFPRLRFTIPHLEFQIAPYHFIFQSDHFPLQLGVFNLLRFTFSNDHFYMLNELFKIFNFLFHVSLIIAWLLWESEILRKLKKKKDYYFTAQLGVVK